MLRYRIPQLALVLVLVCGSINVQDVSSAANRRAVRATPITTTLATTTASPALKREVFGFALASSLGDATVGYPSWNFAALSTVAFFGLHINAQGAIVSDAGWSVWNSPTLTALITKAHSSGTKVVLTIILQDFSPGGPTMCGGLINRATTVAQAAAQIGAKGVDGVNVDYEGLNGTCSNGQTSRDMFTAFVHQLRSNLAASMYLSVDTYASSASDPIGFFDVAGMSPYVDSFFVMAYDLEYSNWHRSPVNCASFCLGPTAPLSSYYYNDATVAAQFVATVPASKVILGVPYYGRKACVGGVAPNAYPIGTVTADSYLSARDEATDPAVSPGSYSVHRDSLDPAGSERWDAWFNTSLGCTRELYWDDVTSLGLKYDLVNRDGLRGVGIWNLNYGGGAPELWTSLLAHFAGCPAVSAVSSPSGTSRAGTGVTITASASGCANANPLYEFWLQAPGAATWQQVQAYSTASTFMWNTTGKQAGTYRLSIWARDAASAGIYGGALGRWDSFTVLSYAVTPAACASASLAFSPASGAAAGMPISMTASSVGCPNPRYEFWFLAPGATVWRLSQAYSAASSLSWKPTAPVGLYRWSVWARDASSGGVSHNSLGSWDAYASAAYALDATCTTVGVSTSPTSAAIGATVNIAGRASSCQEPLVEVWILAPGTSTWRMAQAYSASPTYSWPTAGLAPGVYRFSVWAKDALSAGVAGNTLGRWDAYTSVAYTVFAPCSAVSATFTPASTATSGTSVTVMLQATGCPAPVYEIWMLAPGAAQWQLLRAYGTAPSYIWSTSGRPAGRYQFSVWARDASSPGTAGDALGRWDTYANASYTLS